MRIACILTVFPSVTETFVFADLRALAEAEHDVALLHFIDGSQAVWQEDAKALRGRVLRGGPLLSLAVLASLLRYLGRKPLVLIGTLLWVSLRGGKTLRSRLKTIAILPKCVQFAGDCERFGADQVHAAWSNHAAVAGMVIERLTGIPFSMSAHAGQDIFREPVMLREKVERARFVAICNAHTLARLREIAGDRHGAKLHHLSHGVDLRRFPLRAERIDRQGAKLRLLFVGRLADGKGLPYLIDAVARLGQAGRALQLDIVGDGPEREPIAREIAAGGLEQRVTLHGSVPQARVAEFLAESDLLVVPSVLRTDGGRDGLPNVLLEAMARGVPVVASRVASVAEAVEDEISGLLVDQRDGAALAAAITRVADDPELARRLVEGGRNVVETRFDRRVCGRRFAQLFGESR